MTERFGLRMARTIGVAAVSLLLIVGGAFAANGLVSSSAPRDDSPGSIETGSTESPEATEDANGIESDDDLDDATESPDATDDSLDDATESPDATDDHDDDATASPEASDDDGGATETPEASDDHDDDGDDDSPESTDDHSGLG